MDVGRTWTQTLTAPVSVCNGNHSAIEATKSLLMSRLFLKKWNNVQRYLSNPCSAFRNNVLKLESYLSKLIEVQTISWRRQKIYKCLECAARNVRNIAYRVQNVANTILVLNFQSTPNAYGKTSVNYDSQ